MLKKKPKYEIILKALIRGIEVQIGPAIYGMDNKNRLLVKMFTNNDKDPNNSIWVNFDVSISSFLSICDKATDEEIIRVVFSLASLKP